MVGHMRISSLFVSMVDKLDFYVGTIGARERLTVHFVGYTRTRCTDMSH